MNNCLVCIVNSCLDNKQFFYLRLCLVLFCIDYKMCVGSGLEQLNDLSINIF